MTRSKFAKSFDEDHVSTFITRLNGTAEFFAKQNNEVQAIAESSRLGIPVTISSDPRHHFEQVLPPGWGSRMSHLLRHGIRFEFTYTSFRSRVSEIRYWVSFTFKTRHASTR